MKKILISGYLGFDNFGDEALLHVIIKNLQDLGIRNENITVISNNPGATTNNYNTRSINRWNLLEYLIALISHDFLIFVGGLFQDKTSFRSFLYYFVQLLIASIFQKKILLYGAGIGPLKRRLTQGLFNFAVQSTQILIILRDEASANFVPRGNNVFVTCDPVWSIETSPSFQDKIPGVNWQMPILGISMRNDKNLKMNLITHLSDKITRILNEMKDWQVLLIPCMQSEDIPVLYELLDILTRKVQNPNKIIMLDGFQELLISEQAGILARCDVMIGMRYHALLVPIAAGKPVFGIVYDQKVKSLLDFASQVSVSFREDFDHPWNYFWQNLPRSSEKAKNASLRAESLNKRNFELLGRFIDTGN